jgi:hypothetical protein
LEIDAEPLKCCAKLTLPLGDFLLDSQGTLTISQGVVGSVRSAMTSRRNNWQKVFILLSHSREVWRES